MTLSDLKQWDVQASSSARTIWPRTIKFGTVTHVRRRHVSRDQPCPPSHKGAGPMQRSNILDSTPCPYSLI